MSGYMRQNERELAKSRFTMAQQIRQFSCLEREENLHVLLGRQPKDDEDAERMRKWARWLVANQVRHFIRGVTHHVPPDLTQPYSWFPLNFMWDIGKAWHPKRMQWLWRHDERCPMFIHDDRMFDDAEGCPCHG